MKKNGFTLIELVIAITLTSVILVILTGGLKLAITSWEKGEKSTEVYQRIRSVVKRINEDIASTVLFYYKTDSIDPIKYLAFTGKQYSFSFISGGNGLNPDPKTGTGLKEITYSLDMENFDKPCLMRKESFLHPGSVFKTNDSLNICIIENVSSLTFKYQKKMKTLEGKIINGGWSSNLENILLREKTEFDNKIFKTLPSAIEITIKLFLNNDEDGKKEIPLPPIIIPINSGYERYQEIPDF